MAYGTVKTDNITFDQGGVDQNVTTSGIYRAITSGVTVTGTISATVLVGTTTVSGVTVTGTTVQGTTVQGVSGTFTSLTGTTTTGTTANFVSGVFTTQVSGVTITGTTINGTTVNSITGNFTSLTGVTVTGTTANFVSGVFTTQLSGVTVTGTTANFTSGNFTALSGASTTVTSGIFALGSAAAPSISFTSDPNTGIFSPGADQVAISTNGSGRLFVDSSGRVGVGTASPGSFIGNINLVVGSAATTTTTAGITLYSGTGTYGGLYFADGTSGSDLFRGYVEYKHDADALAFGTASTERMRLDSSGRLGLGTSSPQSNLDVRGTASSSVEILRVGNGTKYLGIGTEGTNYSWIQSFASTALYINPLGNNTILNSGGGSVGIGTSSPATNVDVSSTTGTRIRSSYTNNSGGRDAGFEIYGDISGSFATRASFTYTGNSGLTSLGSSLDLAFSTASTERARIDSSGRLLVGTSTARSNFFNSTNSARLQIEGSGSNDNYALSIVSNYAGSTNGAQVILAKSGGSNVGDNTLVSDGNTIGQVTFQGADGTDFVEAAKISAVVDGTPGANDMPGRLVFSTTPDGGVTSTERMRIGSAGGFKVSNNGTYNLGTDIHEINHNVVGSAAFHVYHSAASTPYGYYFKFTGANPNDATSYVFGSFDNVNANIYTIYSNGTVSARSDAKFKKNIETTRNGYLEDLAQLRVVKYNWYNHDNDTPKELGFIAQEVEQVFPGLVSTVPDKDDQGNETGEVSKSIKTSVFTPMLVKALQEALERIETLEAEVAALKAS